MPVKDTELLALKEFKNQQLHFNNFNVCSLSGKENDLGMKAK